MDHQRISPQRRSLMLGAAAAGAASLMHPLSVLAQGAEEIVIGGSIPMTGVFAFSGGGLNPGIQGYVKIVHDAGGISRRQGKDRPQAEAAGQARDLVPPSQMLPLLETLLGRHHGLKVRSLQSLGRTVLGDGTPTIYRHGVELTVEGRYADLLAYLRALEQSPQRLLWGTLQLRVEQHPNMLLTLRLHTLSTDAHWVEI